MTQEPEGEKLENQAQGEPRAAQTHTERNAAGRRPRRRGCGMTPGGQSESSLGAGPTGRAGRAEVPQGTDRAPARRQVRLHRADGESSRRRRKVLDSGAVDCPMWVRCRLRTAVRTLPAWPGAPSRAGEEGRTGEEALVGPPRAGREGRARGGAGWVTVGKRGCRMLSKECRQREAEGASHGGDRG